MQAQEQPRQTIVINPPSSAALVSAFTYQGLTDIPIQRGGVLKHNTKYMPIDTLCFWFGQLLMHTARLKPSIWGHGSQEVRKMNTAIRER